MTLQSRFDAALAIIREHNDAVGGETKPGYVDPEKFSNTLKAIGGTTEDRLKGLSYEDILECLPAFEGIKPRLLAKEIAKTFRGKDETSNVSNVSNEKRPVSSKTAERMTIRELVEAFDPENSENAVAQQLSKIAKGQAFIVYSSGRFIDVESTIKLLQEVKQGYPGRVDYTTSNGILPVYKIGELPDNFADENPLYENRPLRPDGTCDQTGRSWEGIPLEVKQLIRIGVYLGEIDVKIDKAHEILDVALSVDAMSKLRSRYRKSSLKFDELAKVGKLPHLKVTLHSEVEKNKTKVFDDGKKVVFATPPSNGPKFRNGVWTNYKHDFY